MIPQGTSAVNDLFFTTTISAVNYATSCQAVTDAGQKALDSCNSQIATVQAQFDKLTALMVAPTDLPSVITWINKMIGPMTTAQATLTAQLGKLQEKAAALQSAIDAQKAKLGCP